MGRQQTGSERLAAEVGASITRIIAAEQAACWQPQATVQLLPTFKRGRRMHVHAEQVLLVDGGGCGCRRLSHTTLAADIARCNRLQRRSGGSRGHAGTLGACAGLPQGVVLLRAGGAAGCLQCASSR